MSENSSITFSIENSTNQQSVLYVTQDPSYNLLNFTLSYTGSNPITLKGGTPVAESNITSDGPTSLYFTISSVLTPAEFAAMTVTPPTGWQVANFTSWALTPVEDTVLNQGDSVTFALSTIKADKAPGPGTFNIDYYNIPTVSNSGIQLNLTLEQLPSTHKNLSDVLALTFVGGDEVFIDVDNKGNIPANTLIIRLNNTSTSPIVPSGTSWPNTPVFYLTFVTANGTPGYGALTTIDRVKDFSVSLYKDYGTDWTIQDRTQQDPPHWAIYPKSQDILGVGTDAMVEFKIEEIITDFAPSSTNLYLLSSYIPGYDDGSQVLAIEKKPPQLAIKDLNADPNLLVSGATTNLSWKTFDADTCTLSPVQGASVSVPVQETNGYPLSPTNTTTYTLTAHDNSQGTKISQQITVTVKNVALTKALTADPASGFHYGDPVSLSWTSYSATSCSINPPINGSSNVPLSSSGTLIHPTQFTPYTLTANGQGGPVDSELNIIPIPNGWKNFSNAGPWATWQRPVLVATFQNKLWFFAGGSEAATSSVFSSLDGAHWNVISNNVAYAPRGNAAGCILSDKLWLLGGQTRAGKSNEIWNSSDGNHWTQITPTTIWSARSHFSCLVLADKMWVMGGMDANGTLLNDVWNSSDGVHWTEVNKNAVWTARADFGATIWNGKLCLIAGKSSSGVLNDAWQSNDGIQWTGLDGNISWRARSNPGVCVVGSTLYVIGGTDQSGTSINDSNMYTSQQQWQLGMGPGWGTLIDQNTTSFLDAIWCAGGNNEGVTNTTVWGFGP